MPPAGYTTIQSTAGWDTYIFFGNTYPCRDAWVYKEKVFRGQRVTLTELREMVRKAAFEGVKLLPAMIFPKSPTLLVRLFHHFEPRWPRLRWRSTT
jgi:hypothetical protein